MPVVVSGANRRRAVLFAFDGAVAHPKDRLPTRYSDGFLRGGGILGWSFDSLVLEFFGAP